MSRLKLLTLGLAGSATLLCLSNNPTEEIRKYFTVFKKSANAATAVERASESLQWDRNWDQRDPFHLVNPAKLKNLEDESLKQVLSEVTPTATRQLIFIRHGQYHNEAKDDKLRTLTKLGQEQAVYTGIRLRELNLKYDRIVESSMTRAIETSALIQSQLKDVKVERSDMLVEGSPIQPEPPFRHWRPSLSTYTDGPRIEGAFRKYVHRASASQEQDSIEIFVCHANVIRYFVCRALQVSPEAWLRISLKHGSITWLTVHPSGNVSLRCLGDAGHIPPDKLSSQ